MQSESLPTLHFSERGDGDRLSAFASSRLSNQRELRRVNSTISKDCTDERQLHTERLLALGGDHREWYGSKKRPLRDGKGDEYGNEDVDLGEGAIDTIADPKDQSMEPKFPVITDDDYSYITTADLMAWDADNTPPFPANLHTIQAVSNTQDRLQPKRRRLEGSEHNEQSPPPAVRLSANNDEMDLDIDSQTETTELARKADSTSLPSLNQPQSARFRDYLNRRGVPMFGTANVSFNNMRHHASPTGLG